VKDLLDGRLDGRSSTLLVFLAIVFPVIIRTVYEYESYHMLSFYKVPAVKFYGYILSYIVMLVLLSISVVEGFGSTVTILEYLIIIWFAGHICQEIIQFIRNPSTYFLNIWNQLDFCIDVAYVCSILLHFAAILRNVDFLNHIASYIIVFVLTACYLRFLNFFTLSSFLGPLIIVIGKMVSDIAKFLAVFLIFLIPFSIVTIALVKQNVEGDVWKSFYDENADGVIALGYYVFLGEFSNALVILNQVPLALLFLWVYQLLAQIALANLLIAILSNTYAKVSEKSDTEWKLLQYDLQEEYKDANVVIPFNLFTFPFEIYEVLLAKYLHYRRRLTLIESEMQEVTSTSAKGIVQVLPYLKVKQQEYIAQESEGSIQSQLINTRLEKVETLLTQFSEKFLTSASDVRGDIKRLEQIILFNKTS